MRDNQTSYEGIVILGMPRSGTTLLRRLIGAHPAIHCPPETNLLSAAARFLREEPFAGGLAVGVLPGLAFSGYDEEAVLGRLREFVLSFHREMRDRAGKRLWAEKTAFDSFHVEAIGRLCGGSCRYVCMFRHGLDVVCSLKDLCDEMEMVMDDLHPYVRRFASFYEAFARAWCDVSERLHAFAIEHAELCVRLRYEDLVEHPHEELARLFDFLHEPVSVDRVIGEALGGAEAIGLGDWKTYRRSKIHSESVGRWQKLSPQTVNRLAEIMNPTLERLDYEPVPKRPEVSREVARRQHQVKQMVARINAVQGDETAPPQPTPVPC
jgi:hypothetical protein